MGVLLQCPDDIANVLTKTLKPHFAAIGMEFQCNVVDFYRDIQKMFPDSIGLSGAYKTRNDVESPHSFVFCPRGWLSEPLQRSVEQRPPFMAV